MNSSDKNCGFVRVVVTNSNLQPYSPAQAKVTVAAKWGWQHICLACTHNSKDLCPRGVNHKLLPPIKSPGQADDYIKRTGSPTVTISAKCLVLSLTPAPFVIIPIFPFPLSYCLHVHHPLSHSLKVSPFHSLDWHFLSCLYLTPLIRLSLSILFTFSKTIRVHRDTCVRVTYYHQSQYHSEDVRRCILSICFALKCE